MSNTAKINRKRANADDDHLPKPKRPMTAYDFFFREQRRLISRESGKEQESATGEVVRKGQETDKKSFELGRVIDELWREIKLEDLERYQEMARQDTERYRDEMEKFHKKELALRSLVSSRHSTTSSDETGQSKTTSDPTTTATETTAASTPADERKPTASELRRLLQEAKAESSEDSDDRKPPAMELDQLQQLVQSANAPQGDKAQAPAIMTADQLLQLQVLIRQQTVSRTYLGHEDFEALENQIVAQRTAIQEQQARLLTECESLRKKESMLEKLLSSISGLSGSSNSKSNSSDSEPTDHSTTTHPERGSSDHSSSQQNEQADQTNPENGNQGSNGTNGNS